MTEIVTSGNSLNSGETPARQWKGATLAGILSLLLPGMGQLLNRQPRKALVLAVVAHMIGFLEARTHLFLSFRTMVALILATVLFKLGVAAEAAYSAASGKKAESALPLARVSYGVIAVLVLAATIFPTRDQMVRESGFSAFKIASASMCPTICVGERVVADRNAYKTSAPQRGDIILMKHGSSEALFVKRVIGLPGDVISPGPDGSVLVNGEDFRPPLPCGRHVWAKSKSAERPMCESVKLPNGELFVVGDDLGNSFDSRYKEFDPVTTDMVRGKVLYIYWSNSVSRIGCTLH